MCSLTQPAATPRPRLCKCPLHCFHEVFGNEDFCDFCNAGAAWVAGGECECVGEDMGLDRPCCAGSDDDDSDDAGDGCTLDVPSDAARDVTPPQMLDELSARRKRIQDGGRRLAAFVDFNFYGGNFASERAAGGRGDRSRRSIAASSRA